MVTSREPRYLTIKELADLLDRHVNTCRRNLSAWGLDECRAAGPRVRFFRRAAKLALMRAGLIEPE
jgi:hypothetical protein